MIKKRIAVGTTAISLMAGLAFTPFANAYPDDYPSVSVDDSTVDAGTDVTFSVSYVRTGCKVSTTLGSRTVTDKAIAIAEGEDEGEVVDGTIKAPLVAGTYTLVSQVSKTCADDAGTKARDSVTVGDEVFLEEYTLTALGTRTLVEGLVWDDSAAQALGANKVQLVKGGSVLGSAYTNSVGEFSIVIRLKLEDITTIGVRVTPNKNWFFDGAKIDEVVS